MTGASQNQDAQFKRLPVAKCRVAIHSLGVQVEDENSENHVTINLLLGSGLVYRIDQKIGDESGQGVLSLQGRARVDTNSIIHYHDIKTPGCPQTFDADTSKVSSGPTVQKFVDIALRYKDYRFVYIHGGSDGCRYWV